ncbi:MAG: excinuclease ABC subunit UvrA [Candidatus Lokiarchaeota archaeon]|nr:excinuclease ABC subunit UvrA [Candidatus Lokiarchaeota archaeon]
MDNILIKGARVHNLKNIDMTIPKNKIVAITGVSGSGKSSLAFDIIFQEGMRRYLQSIGFPPKLEEEKQFDSIQGLSPVVAVEQRTVRVTNPRSTVGTRTTLYTLLRMLYAIESRPVCPICQVSLKDDWTCDICGMKETRMEIKHFSFNEPSGMCLECKGSGYIADFTEAKIVPDTSWSLKKILKAASGSFGDLMNFTRGLAEQMGFNMDDPWNTLPEEVRKIFIHGTDEKMKLAWKSKRFEGTIELAYEGVIPHLKRAMEKSTSAYRRDKIEKNYMTKKPCPSCNGHRINAKARSATINGKHIGELATMPASDLATFLGSIHGLKTPQGRAIVAEARRQLGQFDALGISYLHLNRALPSLSGGELQRVSLVSHLEAGLDSVIYLFDEPTMGMHEVEKGNLTGIFKQLRDGGSSVIVVEHDLGVISAADEIIDIGPGAGTRGGELVYRGTVAGARASTGDSFTARYITRSLEVPIKHRAARRKVPSSSKRLSVRGATANNLKAVDVDIPLGVLVMVCGVSGSGKSSLVNDCIVPLLKAHFTTEDEDVSDLGSIGGEFIDIGGACGKLSGWEAITDCITITQAPIGRSRVSNPASYVGVLDRIRELFARQPEAKKRKYVDGHFSFNSDKGRCEACKGEGTKDLHVSFLTSVEIPCEECRGTGFKPEVLEITYKGKNINDVLELTVDEAILLFEDNELIIAPLRILQETGMGYVTLGQPATTLSGGEAQRIKLARELGKARGKGILYVLDEPTTGLHPHDVAKLIALIERLVDQGNTVLVIEHDVDVLSNADWLIELGPGGGPNGGKIIATGMPEDVKKNNRSIIAPFLRA